MSDKTTKQLLDELEWLYMELYGDEDAFLYFMKMLEKNADERRLSLKKLDEVRSGDKDWYQSNKLLGMMLYAQNFGGNLKEVRKNLPYLEECGINYLHLMPLLDSVKGKSDGGYAVADFRKVRPKLGTMEDLEALADACHEKGIALCFDFVLNHTSDEHAWAKAARAGDQGARDRYFFYDSWDIPNKFEQTVPQVFPTTAPGNFTWLDDIQKVVMTTFHNYQWDLNYANPMVFNDMTDNLLYLANRGMDVIRLDAIPYIWKELGTNCRNLPQVHTLIRMMHLACQIVCPGVALLGEVVMEMLIPFLMAKIIDVGLANQDLPYIIRVGLMMLCVALFGLLFGGIGEEPHKRYLNDWFTGKWPGSWARGELYNDAESLGDARACGTTASLCGLECGILEALDNKGDASLKRGLACDLMMHAWMFTQTGIPVIYSGDEIGQLNDYSYHDDPSHWDDSRYLHRGKFDFALAEKRFEHGTLQQLMFDGLQKLKNIRGEHDVFRSDAEVYVYYTGDDRVMGLKRQHGDQTLVALFNFSENPAEATIEGAVWRDLLSGRVLPPGDESGMKVRLSGYAFCWLMKE